MSYEVTATRRRPQHFDDLIGQEFVAETLKNSITSGQIAHAYLFSGPRGCGKTSTARILAKALNCETGPTPSPCGTCTHCQEITKGSSLDVIEIDGASNTSVNDVRQIKDEVMFPPNSSRYKIYIIDEVHMLSTSAFNALLKTIEEPPPYVVFIFATTELQKVPATIKSRCQQFNFRLVSVEKTKNLLADAAKELGIQADDEALYWIARESTGSIRDAYTLFDQVTAFSDGHITYDKIRDKLGLVGVDSLNDLFEKCASGNPGDALIVLDGYLQSGISIEQLISNSANYIRSLLLIKNGVTKESLLGNAAERYSPDVLKTWNTIQTERALSLFLQLYRDIRYSLSPRYELELAFSRLCWLSQYVSPAEVKTAIDSAHALLSGTSTVEPDASQAVAVNNQGSKESAANIPPAAEQEIPEQPVQHTTSDVQNIPHFSALDEIPEKSPPPADISEQGQNHPFPDGGALPPEQTVAAGNIRNTSDTNIQASSVSPAGSPVNTADTWSNTDIPPDGEYTPDDEIMTDNSDVQEEETDEPVSAEEASPFPDDSADEHQSLPDPQQTALYTTADGRSVTIAQLRGTVTAQLSVNDAMTASALMQTLSWTVQNDTITAQIESPYQKARLEQHSTDISGILTKMCGRSLNFIVNLKETVTVVQSHEIPQQIKIICSVFKGSITGGKK
ncbi:MAG: DNA polymerase III subunit gamma/tau [Treponema sp.]|nr:DNA polymerase III subunit gamma/tau [Treponema sp.]